MNTVEAAKAIKATVQCGLMDHSFKPPPPPKRLPKIRPVETAMPVVKADVRDDASSWTIYIEYQDSSGWISERRITILRFEHRVGGWPAVAALCHECGEYRLFRVDRILQVIDISTGEILGDYPLRIGS